MTKLVKWLTAAGIAGSVLGGPLGNIAQARAKPETHVLAKRRAPAKQKSTPKHDAKVAKVAKKTGAKRLPRMGAKKITKAAAVRAK